MPDAELKTRVSASSKLGCGKDDEPNTWVGSPPVFGISPLMTVPRMQ